jgi:hypothetical protein
MLSGWLATEAMAAIGFVPDGVLYSPNQGNATSLLAEVPSDTTGGPVTVVVGGVVSKRA